MDVPDLQTGDIVCFGDRSWISRGIKWFTRRWWGEDKTQCSHVGVMNACLTVCEALAHVEIHPVEPRLAEGWREIYRPVGLTEEQRRAMREQCNYYKGKRYGWWKNAAQAADGLLGGGYIFRRLLFIDNYPICSWLVAWVFERCVERNFFDQRPNAATPDDIHDACQDGERFQLVAAFKNGVRTI